MFGDNNNDNNINIRYFGDGRLSFHKDENSRLRILIYIKLLKQLLLISGGAVYAKSRL